MDRFDEEAKSMDETPEGYIASRPSQEVISAWGRKLYAEGKAEGRREMAREALAKYKNPIWGGVSIDYWLLQQAKGGA